MKQFWKVTWSFSSKGFIDTKIPVNIMSLLERGPPNLIVLNAMICSIKITGNKSQSRVIDQKFKSWRCVPVNHIAIVQDWHENCLNNPFSCKTLKRFTSVELLPESAHKIIYVNAVNFQLLHVQNQQHNKALCHRCTNGHKFSRIF